MFNVYKGFSVLDYIFNVQIPKLYIIPNFFIYRNPLTYDI